jgi:hypothetical protein
MTTAMVLVMASLGATNDHPSGVRRNSPSIARRSALAQRPDDLVVLVDERAALAEGVLVRVLPSGAVSLDELERVSEGRGSDELQPEPEAAHQLAPLERDHDARRAARAERELGDDPAVRRRDRLGGSGAQGEQGCEQRGHRQRAADRERTSAVGARASSPHQRTSAPAHQRTRAPAHQRTRAPAHPRTRARA